MALPPHRSPPGTSPCWADRDPVRSTGHTTQGHRILFMRRTASPMDRSEARMTRTIGMDQGRSMAIIEVKEVKGRPIRVEPWPSY